MDAGAQQQANSQPSRIHEGGVLRLVGHLFAMVGLAIPTLIVLAVVSGALIVFTGFLGSLSSFIVLLGFVMIAAAIRRLKRERVCRLLGYLKIATELNLPLPQFLYALEQGEGAAIGRRARWIANDMQVGRGLGDALFTCVPEMPAHQVAVIWQGERAGRLRESVARAADNAVRESRSAHSARNDVALQYGLVLFVILLGMTALVGTFILPHFGEIFVDFDVVLPEATGLTFALAQQLSPLLLLVSVVALMGVLGWSTFGLFLNCEAVIGPIRRIFGPLWWRVPVVSNSFRDRALADACFMIEQAMRAGRPLPDAIDAARHPVQSSVLNDRLRHFAEQLRQGMALTDAARAARLPTLVVGMLGAANESSQPADVFAFLCRYYTDRVSPAEALIRAAVLPMTTLVAACCVAWFVLMIFYPLVVLIEKTIEVTGLV